MLILENGYIINCIRINKKNSFGEITYHVSNYGYNETITDQSYKGQFLLLSNPHIGNTGFIYQDIQSKKIKLNSILVNTYSISSNFRNNEILFLFLKKKKIQIISNLDVRFILSLIKITGQQIVCTCFGNYNLIIKYIRLLNKYNIYYD